MTRRPSDQLPGGLFLFFGLYHNELAIPFSDLSPQTSTRGSRKRSTDERAFTP